MYIICVINLQRKSDIRSKLPSPLLYSTIYYKVGDLSPEDIRFTTLSIFYKYFGKDGIKEEEDFIEKYNKVNIILIENKSSKLLAFNDINNYAKLRAVTKNIFDKSVIDNMIFYYRTQEKENLLKIKNELNINGFIPFFEYNPCNTELYIKLENNNSNPLVLKVINKDKINKNKIQKKLNTLTNNQRYCLLFLECAWITKNKIILRGDTESGKTHCVLLFSEMLGADLLTYQMNQDLTPSKFNGKSILEENLNDKEIELIKQYLSDINKIKINNINITQIISMGNPHEWKPNIFKNFFIY